MVQDQENIHYRATSKATHSGVEVLKGHREIPRIIIDHIEYVENIQINGRTEKCAFVAHFQSGNGFAELPMIINQTNARRLTKLYPECEGYLARLHNIAVRLTSEACKDPNGGGQTVGLRISQIPAASEQEMQKWLAENGYTKNASVAQAKKTITAEQVDTIVKWAKDSKKTIEDIQKFYDMSDDVKAKIVAALSDDIPE